MKAKPTLAGVLACFALAGAAHAERGSEGELRILSWQAPSNLNPYLAGGASDGRAASIVLEPLVRPDNNGVMIPVLAERVPTVENGDISEDLTSITWTLQSGLLWSDGSPVTAADVVFTAEYCMHPDVGCARADSFDGIANVEALDDLRVRVTYEEPRPFMFAAFSGFGSPIIQAAQFADCLGPQAVECSEQNFGPIGTGAFMVTEFRPGDVILMEANPNYRVEDQPAFATLTYRGGGDATSAARAVIQTGEFDYAIGLQVAPEVIEEIRSGDSQGDVVAAFGGLVETVWINGTNPDSALGPDERSIIGPHPALDLTVRRALSMAIDRELLVEIGYGSAGAPTCNAVPAPPNFNSTTHDCLTQDIAGANALLDEAGWVLGADGVRSRDGVRLEFEFQTSTNSVRQTFQSVLKEWWSEIGVDVTLRNLSASVFFSSDPDSPDTYRKFYADIQMYANGFRGIDPTNYLAGYLCGSIPSPADTWSGSNVSRHCSEEYDALHAELVREADPDRRAELIRTLNDYLIENQIIIPLVQRGDLNAAANSLDGELANAWDSPFWRIAGWSRN